MRAVLEISGTTSSRVTFTLERSQKEKREGKWQRIYLKK